MTPTTWADVANWILLALGAAMSLGTGFALLSFRRTGVFPGQPLDEDGTPVRPPSLTSAYVKIGVGVVIALWGLAGLTTGSVIGF